MLNKIKDKNFFFANNWNETIQEIKNNILVLLKTKDKKIDIELSDAINLRVVIEQKDMKFHFCEDLSNNKKREYEDTIIDFNNKHIDSFIETFLSKIVTKCLTVTKIVTIIVLSNKNFLKDKSFIFLFKEKCAVLWLRHGTNR